jgi:hypothetical protein
MKSINHPIAIPEIVINDPNDYVTSNKIIAELVIRSPHGERRMPFVRSGINKYRVS